MHDPYLKSLLGENEEILLVARQHWFVLFKAIILELIFALVIIVGVVILSNTLILNPIALLGLFLLIIPAISLTRDYLIWSSRKYIVTSRRVIQMYGVFNKSVTDSSLEKVNDLKLTQSFFGRMFDFGDIEILTASELGANLFKQIGDPIRFKTAMINAKARLEGEQAEGPVHHETSVPALIAELNNLRQQGVLTEEEFQKKKAELLAKI
jgi:uncharacterized membrane protein YdbT with pleckstrin-like domain